MKVLTSETISPEVESIDPVAVKQELLRKVPTKVARKRAKQIVINRSAEDGEVPEIGANTRTIPGIITQRGCTYAGCKGVVLGPTRDIVNITHGPIGCGFYSWLTRRNQTRPKGPDGENYMTYCFSTDMQEEDIVFGAKRNCVQPFKRRTICSNPRLSASFPPVRWALSAMTCTR